MGYSLQYCENECGNAVPGNECDWEDGVCDACRERREDEAKGETMAGWTKEDARDALLWHPEGVAGSVIRRAAAHIEALEARVAELEGPCSFCLETPGHGASKPICDGCAQLATDQVKTSRGLVERIAALEADQERLIEAVRADAIPRASLVSALRERALVAEEGPAFDVDDAIERRIAAGVYELLADEIERGEWPGEGER